MKELREIVASAIGQACGCDVDCSMHGDDWYMAADEAIAAATPHIRAAVIEEIASDADELSLLDEADYWLGYVGDWIRTRKDQP